MSCFTPDGKDRIVKGVFSPASRRALVGWVYDASSNVWDQGRSTYGSYSENELQGVGVREIDGEAVKGIWNRVL